MHSDLTPGTQFGSYRIQRTLGTGGMGHVFLAETVGATGLETRVALKVLRLDREHSEIDRRLFAHEGALGSQLDHDHLVRTLEFGSEHGLAYLVTEYVEGATLADLLEFHAARGTRPPLAFVLRLARQISAGLAHLHSARGAAGELLQAVHRDLKPSNILIDMQGNARLADFGVAQSTLLDPSLHRSVFSGTVLYMSPEQAMGKPVDFRSDLYSFGSVLYEMLTLEPLHPQDSVFEVLEHLMWGEVDTRLTWLDDCPSTLRALLHRLLSKDPAQRPASAQEVCTLLESLEAAYGQDQVVWDSVAIPDVQARGWGEATLLLEKTVPFEMNIT